MKHKIAIATVSAVLLTGCAGKGSLTQPFTATQVATPAPYVGVQSASISCGAAIETKSIPPALIGLGVEFALNIGKELLADMQKNRSAVYAATGLMKNCIPNSEEVLKGNFKVQRKAVAPDGKDYGHPAFKLDGTAEIRRVGEKKDHLQIKLEPTEFVYGKAAPRRGGKRKRVIVMLQVGDKAALGAKEAAADLTLGEPVRIDLGEVEEGYSYNSEMLKHAGSSVVMSVPKNEEPVVTAMVVESEDESFALRALSEAYESSRDDLTEALRKIFIKEDDGD